MLAYYLLTHKILRKKLKQADYNTYIYWINMQLCIHLCEIMHAKLIYITVCAITKYVTRACKYRIKFIITLSNRLIV